MNQLLLSAIEIARDKNEIIISDYYNTLEMNRHQDDLPGDYFENLEAEVYAQGVQDTLNSILKGVEQGMLLADDLIVELEYND